MTRKILSGLFSLLVIISIAFSLSPLMAIEANADQCSCIGTCPNMGAPWQQARNFPPGTCCYIDEWGICHWSD